MQKMKKIIAAVVLIFALSMLTSVTSLAAVGNDDLIMPLWDSISSVELDMTFVSGNGNVMGVARKQPTATGIEAWLYLYKEVNGEWVFVDDNYVGFPRGSLGMGIDFPCESGVTYMAIFVVTAYTGDAAESETFYCTETCP